MAGRNEAAAGAIDVLHSIDLNEWNGRRQLELKVVDLRPSAR